jgi:pyruvate formate lyase activating enzyme
MHEALFWDKAAENRVHCRLCRFFCRIAEGHSGRCGVRVNQGGVLYTRVYGRSVASNVDPIEKKPLFHVLPGSKSFSIATVGCNFRCLHCQNATISQWPLTHKEIPGEAMSPDEVVASALAADCRSIAYTYTEPTIYYEYAADIMRLAHAAGLKNVFVSNGYTSTEALEAIAPWLDAANIDLKGFTEVFYRTVTGAGLDGVLSTLRDYRRLGIWLEVTTLIIPGHNDDDAQLQGIAGFIVDELGVDTPWHVTAFYPAWQMQNVSPAPAATVLRARKIGLDAGLHHVYVGNIPGTDGETTYCPNCRATVLARNGYRINELQFDTGRCRCCGTRIAGVWT